jgi:amidohydrolase
VSYLPEPISVRAEALALREPILAWRRHLHRHPEVSFHEIETSAYIAGELGAIPGLDVDRPTATSVVARLAGARPGPCVALRADIDALPVRE